MTQRPRVESWPKPTQRESTPGFFVRLKRRWHASPESHQQQTKIDRLRKALQSDPQNERLLHALADLYVAAGQIKPATEAYFKAAERYRQAGHLVKAVALYRQLVGLRPHALNCHRNFAVLLEQLGRHAEAAEIYHGASKLAAHHGHTDDANFLSHKAMVLRPREPAPTIEMPAAQKSRLLREADPFPDDGDTDPVPAHLLPSATNNLEHWSLHVKEELEALLEPASEQHLWWEDSIHSSS